MQDIVLAPELVHRVHVPAAGLGHVSKVCDLDKINATGSYKESPVAFVR